MSTINLTLLHTNDLHGRVKQVARIGSLVRRIKNEVNSTGGTCLYLDAGDSEDSILPEVVEAYIRRHSPLGNVGVGRITFAE